MIDQQPRPAAAIASILTGQAVVVVYTMGWVTASGYMPALPVIIGSLAVYIAVHFAAGGKLDLPPIEGRTLGYGLALMAVFLAAMDFWNWGKVAPLILGIPGWVWYSIGLSAVQTVLMVLMLRGSAQRDSAPV